MLELNIQDLRKKALIKFSLKPEGHVFGVHRLTGGDELKLNELSRRANKLIIELEAMRKADTLDEKVIKNITDKMDKLELERRQVKASVFEDGGDGSLSMALMLELTDEEVARLVNAVESDQDIVVAPPDEKSDVKTT